MIPEMRKNIFKMAIKKFRNLESLRKSFESDFWVGFRVSKLAWNLSFLKFGIIQPVGGLCKNLNSS